jgi:hypothetical protein
MSVSLILVFAGSALAARPTNATVTRYVQRQLSRAVPMTAAQQAAFGSAISGRTNKPRQITIYGKVIDDRTTIYLPSKRAKRSIGGLPPKTMGIIEQHEQSPDIYELIQIPKSWTK